MTSRTLALAVATVAALAAAAPAEEIVLGDDRLVRGPIVKETADEVFVDLGYTILGIPRRHVRAIEADAGAPSPAADEPATLALDPSRLYTRRAQPEASVRENVERVGAGVVLVKVPGALGSGFVVRSDGYVVTNAHVVEGEQNVSVTVFRHGAAGLEKSVYEKVAIVAVNPYWDLALLRVEDPGVELEPIPFGNLARVRAGDTVFAVGNPLGLERSVSEGIVSTTNRAYQGQIYIQTTAAINPGNSGGPLFTLRGEMIGVTTWGYLGTEGLNFAIPASTVEAFLDNRDAFAYDKEAPNSGYRYPAPPRRGTSAASE